MPLRLPTSRRLSPSLGSTSPFGSGEDAIPSSSATTARRFSTTPRVAYPRSRQATHYETLNVPVTATAAEIKKQFYALSLKHHPDRNRSDPNATERFANISSAYQTLRDSSKRARYDRDHGIAATSQHPMGSHSSAGTHMRNASGGSSSSYVGSRPASGLSKRRGTFKGPPPSFYAHGGYGARGSRPGAASGSYTGTGGSEMGSSKTSGTAPTEEDPSSFIHNNPVWHFNAKGHFKTQAAEDARREQRRSHRRRSDQEIRDSGVDSSGSLILRFMIVSGILVSVASLGGILRNNKSTTTKQPNSRNKDR
ncbi:DnaJ domain protein [Talaromyces islandicus]|uniref:DnaJ domain protein n=1 Tax=Talaromyces islandicus TaxID=28573 RepID=A0A0U1LQ42_TALIS|nr:DnaJ domain protein [Talaromyces islandicus]